MNFELSDAEQSKVYKQQIDLIRAKLIGVKDLRITPYEEWKSDKKNKVHELKQGYSVYCIVFFNTQLHDEDTFYVCVYKGKLFSIIPLFKGKYIVGWLPGQVKR